jgi:hypothetical protein
VQVSGNDMLRNVDGLSGLDAVPGDLLIAWNDELIQIDGVAGVTWVGGDLVITNNASLNHVNGLEGITAVDGDVVIENNERVCTSQVDVWLAGVSVGGVVTVQGNRGC